MYDLKETERVEREFAEQDKRWDAKRFIGLGFVTLAIMIFFIVFSAWKSFGCTVAIVP